MADSNIAKRTLAKDAEEMSGIVPWFMPNGDLVRQLRILQ